MRKINAILKVPDEICNDCDYFHWYKEFTDCTLYGEPIVPTKSREGKDLIFKPCQKCLESTIKE